MHNLRNTLNNKCPPPARPMFVWSEVLGYAFVVGGGASLICLTVFICEGRSKFAKVLALAFGVLAFAGAVAALANSMMLLVVYRPLRYNETSRFALERAVAESEAPEPGEQFTRERQLLEDYWKSVPINDISQRYTAIISFWSAVGAIVLVAIALIPTRPKKPKSAPSDPAGLLLPSREVQQEVLDILDD